MRKPTRKLAFLKAPELRSSGNSSKKGVPLLQKTQLYLVYYIQGFNINIVVFVTVFCKKVPVECHFQKPIRTKTSPLAYHCTDAGLLEKTYKVSKTL